MLFISNLVFKKIINYYYGGIVQFKNKIKNIAAWINNRSVDYVNDIALEANSATQAESLLHSLKQAAGGIGLHVNADKTEYM